MLPYINVPFEYASGLTGAAVDDVKLLGTFFLSYPLAAVLKRLPDDKPQLKNLFLISVSLFYLVGLFDLWGGLRTVFISSAGAYAMAKYVDSPFMPWLAFVFLMGHMSVNHIHRQMLDDPSVLDITGTQMVLVMKLTGFCWNVQDGRQPEKDLADFQKSRALREMPSLLNFAGYVLFFPGMMVGPAFDYIDFKRWIECTMFEVPPGTDPTIAPKVNKQRKIPRSGTPAAIKAATGLLWVGLFLVFSGWYNTQVVLGDEFLQLGFLRRVWTLEMLGVTTRLKYYGVWTLTEGACILSGLGYKGFDAKTGRVRWDRLQNVNPLGIEMAQNSRAYLENWNMNTNNWLRNYMYLRVTPKGRKPGFRASLATFTTSAFWHGFYPGYYLSFVFAAFIQTVAKNFRRHVRPFFMMPDGQKPTKYKPFYDAATYVATQAIFCFTTAPFVLLTLSDSLLVWQRVYYYAIVAVAASTAFFASPGKAWLARRVKQRSVRGGAGPRRESYDGRPLLGLPGDPEKDVIEVIAEISAEVENRRRRGSTVAMPKGEDLVRLVQQKMETKKTT